MTGFRFRLQRVLEWRRTQLEIAEAHFRQQADAVAGLDRARAELEAAGISAEMQVRAWRPLGAGDLAALGNFRLLVRNRERQLAVRRAEAEKELATRQEAMLEARRRYRLLERLRERRLADWQAAADKEVEDFAAEAYLAHWPRREAAG
jgi:flagellar export protein FliJ